MNDNDNRFYAWVILFALLGVIAGSWYSYTYTTVNISNQVPTPPAPSSLHHDTFIGYTQEAV